MEDLNNKYIGTLNNKLNKSSLIVSAICNEINNNQDIKRLLFYSSLNPLSPVGKYYDNSKKKQPDINFTLLGETEKSKQLIFDEAFNPSMIIEQNSCIYVSDVWGILDDTIGEIGFEINIVVPYVYNKLMNLGEKRTHLIAGRIADFLDMITIDKNRFFKYSPYLGNIQFILTDYNYGRVAKNNDMLCFNMQFVVKKATLR